MDRQLRILILEDNASDAELVRRELRKTGLDFTAQVTPDKASYLQALDTPAPDLILADYSLPGFDGLTALSLARQRFGDLPVVIVSGAIGEETAIEALKAGATDYVLKQRLSRLGPVVKRALLAAKQSAEKKLAEEEVARQREWLRVTLTSIGDAVIASDTQGRVTFLNPVAASLTGWSEEEAVGQPVAAIFQVINEKTRQPADDVVARVLCDKRIVALANDSALVAKDGREVPIEDSAAPILGAAGDVVGVVLVFHDVAAKRRAAEAIRQAKEEWERTFNTVPDFVAVMDEQHRIVRVNRPMAERLGVTPEQCVGLRCYEVVHGTAQPPEYCPHVQTCRDGRQHAAEVHEPRLGGHFLVSTTPQFDEQGRLMGTVHVARDITERKRAEEALREAKAAAEAANEAKGRFLANISHELRTPMNAILGMIDVALPKAADPTVQDCLQTARGSADLLLTLLNDLLDSARVESGKLELESAPFSLRRMLDQITRVLAVRASEKGLCFYCRIPQDIPDALAGDRMRLQQILLNLAGNAVKFTERGEVEITLRVVKGLGIGDWGLEGEGKGGGGGRKAEGGRRSDATPIPNPQSPIASVLLEFAVRDTGIGIAAAVRERLFHRFAQADTSMARRFGGTGLGLSICKSLVGLMGGRIWVESEPGNGSTFYFTVRLSPAREPPADLDAPPAMPPAACRPLHILLVEDNPANQKLATYILQDRGHAVAVAGDGREAIALAGLSRYDVILMDLQMPGMNGLEATAAIRRREAERVAGEPADAETRRRGDAESRSSPRVPASPRLRVPIIAMTAHAMKGDRDRCLAAGMDGYLSKPVNARELVALVESLAGGGAGSGEQGAGSEEQGAGSREQGAGSKERAAGDGEPGLGGKRPGRRACCDPCPGDCPPLSPPVFNRELALSRCFDNPDMLREMVQGFFDDVEKLVPQMRAALEKGDLVELGRLGHRMKGTVVYLGAEPARQAAATLEQFCEPDPGVSCDAEEAVNALDEQCRILKAALAEQSAAL
jgi:PAS domain S-box-containing protein